MAEKKPRLESTFQALVKKDLQTIPNSLTLKIQQTAICGHPDIMFFCNGLTFFIELKRNRYHKAKSLQRYVLYKAHKTGVFSFVAHPENWRGILLFIVRMSESKYEGYENDYLELRPAFETGIYLSDPQISECANQKC